MGTRTSHVVSRPMIVVGLWTAKLRSCPSAACMTSQMLMGTPSVVYRPKAIIRRPAPPSLHPERSSSIPDMSPASIPTVAQITTSGRSVQAKNDPITIKNVVETAISPDSDSASDSGAREFEVSAVRGAYLHVPFCFHKCHYCDFYSIVDNRDRQAVFTDRLIAELDAAADYIDIDRP